MMYDFMIDKPVRIYYQDHLLSTRGILGCVLADLESVDPEPKGEYLIILDTALLRYPALMMGVFIHELAHIRYGTFESKGQRLYRALLKVWKDSGHVGASNSFYSVVNLLDDLRIEYRLMQEFPDCVEYLATLQNVIKYIPRPITVWNILFEFVRTGNEIDGFEDLYEYLWTRALFARRAPSFEEVVRIANEVVAYVYMKYKHGAGISSHMNARLDRSILYSLSNRGMGANRGTGKAGNKSSGVIEVKPWGAIRVPGSRSKGFLSKGYTRFLKKYVKRWVEGGNRGGGGLSYTDQMRILWNKVPRHSGFAHSVIASRQDEIRDLVEIFKRISLNWKKDRSREGEILSRYVQQAYVSSFNEEGRWLFRKEYRQAHGDVVVALDVSGSMMGREKTALSDAIVLTRVFEILGYRVNFCTVADHMTILKDFDDVFDYSTLIPGTGGGTNFHLFFERLKKLNWKSPRKVVCIVSDGIWYDRYNLNDPFFDDLLLFGIITDQRVHEKINQFKSMEAMIREMSAWVRSGWFSIPA